MQSSCFLVQFLSGRVSVESPYVTGWGFLADKDDVYYDGGFSRILHPACEHRLDLPLIWETLIHTFSPGLNWDQVHALWQAGNRYDYPLGTRRRGS